MKHSVPEWPDFKFGPINLYVMPKPYEMWYSSIEDWWYE